MFFPYFCPCLDIFLNFFIIIDCYMNKAPIGILTWDVIKLCAGPAKRYSRCWLSDVLCAGEKGLAFLEMTGQLRLKARRFNRRLAHRCLGIKYKIPLDSTVGRSGFIFEVKTRIGPNILFSKIAHRIFCIFKNVWDSLCDTKIYKGPDVWSRFRNVRLGVSIT